MHKWSL